MLNTSNQKSFIIFLTFFLHFSLCIEKSFATVVLEDFSTREGKKISDDDWKSRNGEPNAIYKILKEDQNIFIRAHDNGSSVQLFKKQGWQIGKNHVLSWKWRVTKFPKGSDEKGGLNDSAAGVYVVFPNRFFIPESIKYIWSEVLPVGTIIRRNQRFPLIVIRSGKSEMGKWVTEERDVYEDFKKLFGRNPSDPVAFGMLTDANDTKSEAIADYDDFKAIEKLSPVIEQPKIVVEQPKKVSAKISEPKTAKK